MTPGRRPNGQKIMVILPPPQIKLDVERSKTTTVSPMENEHDHEFCVDSSGNVVRKLHQLNANNYVFREAYQGDCYRCGRRGHVARHCFDASSLKICLLGMLFA